MKDKKDFSENELRAREALMQAFDKAVQEFGEERLAKALVDKEYRLKETDNHDPN